LKSLECSDAEDQNHVGLQCKKKKKYELALCELLDILLSVSNIFFTASCRCVGTLFHLTSVANHFQPLRLAFETMTCNKQRVFTRDARLKDEVKHLQHLLSVWRSKILIPIANHRPKIR
jgi:hypothetical protein